MIIMNFDINQQLEVTLPTHPILQLSTSKSRGLSSHPCYELVTVQRFSFRIKPQTKLVKRKLKCPPGYTSSLSESPQFRLMQVKSDLKIDLASWKSWSVPLNPIHVDGSVKSP